MNPNGDVKPTLTNLTSVAGGMAENDRSGATTPQPLSDFLQQLEDYVPTVSEI